MKTFIYLFAFLMLLACDESNDRDFRDVVDTPPDDPTLVHSTCIVDRQCNRDAYHDYISGDSNEDHRQGLIDYFHSLDISIYKAEYDRFFYEAVCEACYVCPSGSVFPVEMLRSDIPLLLSKNHWLTDCSKETNYVRMYYAGTQCADPWREDLAPDADDEQHKFVVASYLVDRGIVPGFVEVTEGEGEACLACVCKSGVVYEILASQDDVEQLIQIGFQQL